MTPAQLAEVIREHGAMHQVMATEIRAETVPELAMLNETQKQTLAGIQLGLWESFQVLADKLEEMR